MRFVFPGAAADRVLSCAYMSLGCANVMAPTATPGRGGSAPARPAARHGRRRHDQHRRLRRQRADRHAASTCSASKTTARAAPARRRRARTAARPPSAASSTTRPARRRSTTSSSTSRTSRSPTSPTGASCDTCASPYSGASDRRRADRLGRALLARARARRRQHPAGDPDREVAARGHDPVGRGVRRHAGRRVADAPAAQPRARGTSRGSRSRTAASDALNCLLKKIGVDAAEFTSETGAGRVNQYAGLNAPTTNARRHDADRHVDAVGQRRGDEGVRHHAAVVRGQRQQRRGRGADGDAAGGEGLRRRGRPRVRIALAQRLGVRAARRRGRRSRSTPRARTDSPATSRCRSSTSFPKGMAFAEWMVNVGGSTTLRARS